LLILQELGEYELVLKLGCPYLNSSSISPENSSSDIVLTVTLAYLELVESNGSKANESAAISLEAGQEVLLHEGIFPHLQGEIQADLYKLRPYRIIELLAQPEENVAQRRQGLQLLEQLCKNAVALMAIATTGLALVLMTFCDLFSNCVAT
jgi:hypothetical protein